MAEAKPPDRMVCLGRLAVSNLSTLLAARDTTEAQLLDALACMRGIPWSYPILVGVGAQRVSTVLRRAKQLHGQVAAEADTLRRHLLCSHAQPAPKASAPEAPAEWIALLQRTQADVNAVLPELRRLTSLLKTLGIEFPYQLGARPEEQLDSLCVIEDDGQVELMKQHPRLLPQLWAKASTLRGQRLLTEAPPEGADPGGLFALADRLYADSLEETDIARDADQAMGMILQNADPHSQGPCKRIRLMSESNPSPEELQRVADLRAQRAVLGLVKGSLKSVASGIRCWATFCMHTGAQAMPPKVEDVRRYLACFRASATAVHYLAHLEKACLLLGHCPKQWHTYMISQLARGIRAEQDGSYRSREALSLTALQRITCNGIRSKCELATVISWIFALRAQSECFKIRVATAADRPTDPCWFPASGNVLALTSAGLVLKFARRKCHPRGDTSLLPCCCRRSPGFARHVEKRLCPTCSVWPAVCAQATPGQEIFRGYSPQVFLRELRQALGAANVPDAERYTLHCIRRGAARAVIQQGGTLGDVLRACSWQSTTFKLYLEMTGVEATAMFDMLYALHEDSV